MIWTFELRMSRDGVLIIAAVIGSLRSMFSLLFGGRLGEFIAPRLITHKELWALIKGGLADKALVELRKNTVDVNEIEPSSGMALLHLTCAQGAMELVVELLSQGADIGVFSGDGNNCLHYAAINDRKGIVEILLRSGADPSIPNRAGILPVELAKTPAVRELFLRDRSAIFSPIVQTRMLLTDYIEQMHLGSPTVDAASAPAASQNTTDSAAEPMVAHSSSNSAIFNMSEALEQSTPPPSTLKLEVEVDSVVPVAATAASPSRLSRCHGAGSDSPAPGTPSVPPASSSRRADAAHGDFTFVGVASVKKPPQASSTRVVEEYDSSENSTDLPSRSHPLPLGGSSAHSSRQGRQPQADGAATLDGRLFFDQAGLNSSSSADAGTPRKTSLVPKLNLGDLSALSPPPTDADCAFQGYGAGGAGASAQSARSGGALNTASSTSSASRSNSVNFYQPPPMPVPPVIGAMTTPRTERSDNNSRPGLLSSASQDAITPQPGASILVGGADELDLLQDEAEMRQAVLQAAAQTAAAMQSNRDDFEARRLMVRNCQKLNESHLRKLLTFDPSLAMSRTTEMGNLAVDGQTPLHVAASFGNTAALKIMVEKGEGVSLWVRDLQGRTPLHVAAEKGQQETCEYLRQAMQAEKNKDPIGEHAPIDLVGTTPLGWATIGSKGKPKKGDMIKALFSPGDRSVLPRTPVSTRAGKSPWKAPPTAGYDKVVRENVVFAFSEANGWTPYMEDRILVSCPVTGRPAWSLFGVCDGHGGAFCSEFLANHIPAMLAKEAAVLARYMGSSYLPGGVANDSDTTPHQLRELLMKVCIDADAQLSEHPRMFVEHSGTARVKYTCMDSSGSTAILALVTSQFVAVGNVGDSRAVLAQRSAGQGTAAGVLSSPFPSSPRSSLATRPSEEDGVAESAASTAGGSSAVHLLEAVGLSRDHKVSIPEEKARIEAAGAIIEQVGEAAEGRETVFQISTPACDVKLRMTRSFGDFYLKQNKDLPYEQQAVVAVPEVTVHTRSSRDAFIVLACDGIWDVMTNQDVVDFMSEKLGYTAYGGPVGGVSTQSAAAACDALLQACLERGTVDNISVVLVVLGAPAQPGLIVSARGTPSAAGAGTGLNEALALTGATASTPPHRSNTGSRATHQNHPAHVHHSRSAARAPADDSEVDLPIFDLHRPGGAGSLNEIFAAVAEEEDDAYVGSPLNTAAGSGRVKKHLNFNAL